MAHDWYRFFGASQCLSSRRGRGTGEDLELMTHDASDGPILTVRNITDGRSRSVLGDYGSARNAILTADGKSILNLLDDNGSEMGHVWTFAVDGSSATDLTPGLQPYTLRGIDTAREGTAAVLVAAATDGFSLWLVDTAGKQSARRLFTSQAEAWNGLISADGRWACLDTTDHNPGMRRFAVTVVPTRDSSPEPQTRTLSDGPEGPVRGIRFSPVPADDRILVATERSGFIRPCIWNFIDGSRSDLDAQHVDGDLVPLDWSDDAAHVLLVHVDQGVHHVLEWDTTTGQLQAVQHATGAFFEPDIASAHLNYWASHYGADGNIRLLHQRFDTPLSILRVDRASGAITSVWSPDVVHPGIPLTSHTIRSLDGTAVQMWAARPKETDGPVPVFLSVHGGPQLVTVDRYTPEAQAWLHSGFAYAAVNYRGSQTFGRRYREGFWQAIGERELEDIAACVEWLVNEGIADKDKIFISGASYGGFLSLLALGRLPGVFAGAMAFVPMADWVTGYEDMNPALRGAWRSFFHGGPEDIGDVYQRASPITYVQHVRAPAWIKTGTHDTRTPPRQVYAYAKALEDAGGDVTLEWFSGGHETTSRKAELADQERMMELAAKAIRGEPWAQAHVTPPPPGSVCTDH
ncbi:prolyl oligopeptidase family serine peptidase [Streptomyces sp. NPDC054962]